MPRHSFLWLCLLIAPALIACDSSTAAAPDPNAPPSPTPIPTVNLSIFDTPAPALEPSPTVGSTPAVAQPSNPTTYAVQAGDTLFSIAQKYGVSVEALAAANNITDPGAIVAGQVLVIPVAGSVATPEPATPTATPEPPTAVNGIPIDSIVVMDDEARQHVRDIYATGQALGRNTHAFSKLGDSTIENPHFLARFDEDDYNLADYAYLQGVIDYYQGSFGRQGVTVRRGLHSWSVFDPLWADKALCQPDETVLACEFRLHNPSVILIRLGSNDIGVPDSFRLNLRKVVSYTIASGVIPVLGTKADRNEGPGNINNDIIRQVAKDYKVPLWDFDLVAETLPGRGLSEDNVHMTFFYEHNYALPEAFRRGHAVHNLTALIALDKIMRVVRGGE